ncbi:MAG: class I SAM-dependent methyltransferase [Nannocystaceae bacterium]|nr:class I SAM-dependent methyltransferase [bacterium]
MAVATNLREQKVARMVEREVGPVWDDRFARLLWRHLPPLREGMVLDLHSGVGNTIEQLLTRLPASVRVLGLEPTEAKRSLAKSKIAPEWKNRVYLKAEGAASVADMGDALYDLVVANLVLSEAHDLSEALEGLIRVTKPGGTVMATLPMHGTWAEAEDLLREVLRDEGLDKAQNRLRRMAGLRPTGPSLATVLGGIGLSPAHYVVEQERFTLLFGSGREFLFSPLVELGPLRLWKAVIESEDGNPQRAFFRFKEAIDAYCTASVFTVTAVAGAIILQRPMAGEDPRTLPGAHYWRRYPGLDAMWLEAESGRMPDESLSSDIDVDLDADEPGGDEPESESAVVTAPQRVVPTSAEDEALRALMETPVSASSGDNNLDALLDQVLEFDSNQTSGTTEFEELDDEEVELVDVDPRRPGETLKRIKALLPPPKSVPPPPPGGKKSS